MKISAITVSDVAEFIRLDEITASEQSQLSTYLAVAKDYIHNYTGLPADKYAPTVDTEPMPNKAYYYKQNGVYVRFTGEEFAIGITYYEQIADEDMDDYDDLTIVALILCQDFYDNRSMYVDKSNPNKVVDTILGMHCRVNL